MGLGSGVEAGAGDGRPFSDAAQVAGLPVREVGLDGEARLDDEVQGGLILEAPVNRVVFARGIELNEVDGFAPDLFEAVKAASAIAKEGGLAMPGDDGFEQRARFSGFDCGLG